MGTGLVVAPDDSGAAIGAGMREFRHGTIDLGPAQLAIVVEPGFEHDRRTSGAAALDLHPPAAANIDKTSGSRICGRDLPAFDLLPDHAHHQQKRKTSTDRGGYPFEDSLHDDLFRSKCALILGQHRHDRDKYSARP